MTGFQVAPECLAPAELRFGVEERTSADGIALKATEPIALEKLAEQIAASGADAIAISLLFSFANPANESMVHAALKETGLSVSVSHSFCRSFASSSGHPRLWPMPICANRWRLYEKAGHERGR